MKLDPGDDKPNRDEDEIPRQGLLASIPKRTLSRVLILLAALVGIIYLRGRTESIAGCMSSAFHAPVPSSTPAVKVRLAHPVGPLDASVK